MDEVPFTFNRIKRRPKFDHPAPTPDAITKKALESKLEKRAEDRCSTCGSLKERQSDRFNEDGAKFRMVCMNCKRKKRMETRAKKRNEAK